MGEVHWGSSHDEFLVPVNASNAVGQTGDHQRRQLSDGVTELVYFEGRFRATPTSILLIAIPTGGTNGQDIVWSTTTDFAAVGEAAALNSDVESLQVADCPTMDAIQSIELIASFTGAAGGDYFGLAFSRVGGDGSDSFTGSFHVLGLYIVY